jgi:hypothetical protein
VGLRRLGKITVIDRLSETFLAGGMRSMTSAAPRTGNMRGNSYVGAGFELAGYPRRASRNPLAYSRWTARRLWRLSEQLTGVQYDFSVS